MNRMEALREQMDYEEEMAANAATNKLSIIVSAIQKLYYLFSTRALYNFCHHWTVAIRLPVKFSGEHNSSHHFHPIFDKIFKIAFLYIKDEAY